MREEDKSWSVAALPSGADSSGVVSALTEKVSAVRRQAVPYTGLSKPTLVTSRKESTIAAGSRIRGTLQFSERVVIDGTIDGEVIVEGELIVGEAGVLSGNVTATKVRVAGRLKGDIHAEERIELSSSSNVSGDLHCPRIAIEDGAVFEGSCFMGDMDALRDSLEGEAGRDITAGSPSDF